MALQGVSKTSKDSQILIESDSSSIAVFLIMLMGCQCRIPVMKVRTIFSVTSIVGAQCNDTHTQHGQRPYDCVPPQFKYYDLMKHNDPAD